MPPLPARHAAAGVAALLLAACAPDATAPSVAPLPPAPTPSLDVATYAAVAAGPAARFLPPLAPQPTYAGPFDATALDRLAVEVCALDAAGAQCAAPPLQRSTSTVGASANEKLRLNASRELYLVYWNTGANGVVATTNYRIRVLLDGAQIGKLDVDVVPTQAGLAAVDRSRFVGVVLGGWAPINFRVEQPATAPTIAASLLDGLAASFQTAMTSAATREPAIREVLGALVRIVPPAEAGQLEALASQGIPFVLDEQIPTLARAFGDGSLVNVDQFVAAANAAGARTQAAAAVTRAYLTQQLQPIAARAEHDAETVLPALVMALGRERARKAGGAIDPVWGDGRLDPVQTLLLLYAFNFSGGGAALPGVVAAPAPALAASAPAARVSAELAASAATLPQVLPDYAKRFGPGVARNIVVGEIGKKVEMPLTWLQAAKTSVCGSILLYGHKFALAAQATDVERRHAKARRPVTTEITATLTFDFTPSTLGTVWLATPGTGCSLPPNGPAAARSVEWMLNTPLGEHGALHGGAGSYTDGAGRAFATYRTFDETVPEALHSSLLQRSATGTVDVRAKGLIPGWSNLERSVGVGVYNPTDAGIRLNVFYYEMPRLEYHTDSYIRQLELFSGTYVSTVDVTVPLEPRTSPGGYRYYVGRAPITRTVNFQEASFPCHHRLSSLETPSEYSIVVTFDGASGDEIVTYVNAPFWGEYWDIPVPTPSGCTYRTERLGNYFGVDWQHVHVGEALFANPFRISDFPFPFLFKIQGWVKPATGNALTKTYDRAETFLLERTNMELRIAP